jgi:hypothetical protein
VSLKKSMGFKLAGGGAKVEMGCRSESAVRFECGRKKSSVERV